MTQAPTQNAPSGARRIGKAAALALLIPAGLALIAGGALLGVLGGDLINVMRRSELNADGTAAAAGGYGEIVQAIPIPVALAVIIAAFVLYHFVNRAYAGHNNRYVVASPYALVLLGVTIGAAWSVYTQWVDPDQVGETAGEAWGLSAWITYTAQFWLVPLLGIITLILLIAGARGGRKADARLSEAQRLVDAGASVPGVVKWVDPEPVPGQGFYWIEWEVEFADASGNPQTIRRTEAFTMKQVPKVGQHVSVLRDAAHPNDDNTFISVGDGSDVQQYLRRVY